LNLCQCIIAWQGSFAFSTFRLLEIVTMKNNYRHLLILFLICLLVANATFSQVIRYGTNNYIEYQVGTLPIVISVPHGGYLYPNSIPDRTCNNPVYATDAFTIELAEKISNSLFKLTGCYPHIIYNNLKRSKLDCNRNLSDGACGNSEANIAWNEFHNFIDTAQLIANQNFNDNTIYIDLHGHGNSIQRIELGYLLYDDELELADSILNTNKYINYSTIKNLVYSNANNLSHSQLLRGDLALGTLLGNAGYPSVPSRQIPFPGTQTNYYSGGYNIAEHTCYTSGNTENGLQMECNYSGIRDSESNRVKFADSLAAVLMNFIKIHRKVDVSDCNSSNGFSEWKETLGISVFPNPIKSADHILYVAGNDHMEFNYLLLALDGRTIESGRSVNDKIVLLKNLIPGVYLLTLQVKEKSIGMKVLVE
jgi:hypothetical protein